MTTLEIPKAELLDLVDRYLTGGDLTDEEGDMLWHGKHAMDFGEAGRKRSDFTAEDMMLWILKYADTKELPHHEFYCLFGGECREYWLDWDIPKKCARWNRLDKIKFIEKIARMVKKDESYFKHTLVAMLFIALRPFTRKTISGVIAQAFCEEWTDDSRYGTSANCDTVLVLCKLIRRDLKL